MEQSLREFVVAVQDAYMKSSGFSAIQTIEAGDIRVTASVAVNGPLVSIDYTAYADPFSKLQELLLGSVAYSQEDVPNLRAAYDGRGTWIHDRSRGLAVRHPGWFVPSPFPSLRVLGELRFLSQMTSDFLVADGTSQTLNGREGREIRLKPRVPFQSQFLRELRFPFRTARILFDTETYFPLRISAIPYKSSPLAMLLPPKAPLVLSYRDVRRDPPDALLRYTPSDDVRRFIERVLTLTEALDLWPCELPIDTLSRLAYSADADHVNVIWNDASSQGQIALEFNGSPASPESSADIPEKPPRIILHVANYLLHNLGRKKADIASHGSEHTLNGRPVRILDRSSLAAGGNAVPGLPRICEAFWEVDGMFWFLLSERLDEPSLLQLVTPLIESQTPR